MGICQVLQENLPLFNSDRLPHRPYTTDDMAHGLVIRPLETAIKKKYIQPNAPSLQWWLVFDVDREGAAFAAEDAGVCEPNITAINPANGHGHLFYAIESAIITSTNAHLKPIRYAAAVQEAYLRALRADDRYAGLIAKNPLNPYWRLKIGPQEAYTLELLANSVDFAKKDEHKPHAYGLGRNCALFDNLRYWAYKHVGECLKSNNYDAWHQAVFAKAQELNIFPAPLPISEIKATAKSVAKWTWKHCRDFEYTKQAARARKKGNNSRKKYEEILWRL